MRQDCFDVLMAWFRVGVRGHLLACGREKVWPGYFSAAGWRVTMSRNSSKLAQPLMYSDSAT